MPKVRVVLPLNLVGLLFIIRDLLLETFYCRLQCSKKTLYYTIQEITERLISPFYTLKLYKLYLHVIRKHAFKFLFGNLSRIP